MTTRHEFLSMLHTGLQPRGYLEIGVFYGDSLRLAKCPAVGIDPAPLVRYHLPSTRVFAMTSDQFFADDGSIQTLSDYLLGYHIDLAFIDGMHLFEFAYRDFMNIERYSNPRTVVVFDDVLPRNWDEAAREQCPGDWTGDVWKVPRLLKTYRPDLTVLLVDTEPTGTCVVFGLRSEDKKLQNVYPDLMTMGLDDWNDVPEEVLTREGSVTAEKALDEVLDYVDTLILRRED
jgi:hypothetical protein